MKQYLSVKDALLLVKYFRKLKLRTFLSDFYINSVDIDLVWSIRDKKLTLEIGLNNQTESEPKCSQGQDCLQGLRRLKWCVDSFAT